MKTKFKILFLMTILLSSCSDPIETQEPLTMLSTRSSYDSEYVEWDNVDHLSYRINSNEIRNDLIVPWMPGSTTNMGIPDDWIDLHYRDSNAANRMYSQANGWQLVYSNLMMPGEYDKYFALYNKYTGQLRIFFRSLDTTTEESSSVVLGVGITGQCSLLNFHEDYPLPMSNRRNNTFVHFMPSSMIFGSSQDVGYRANIWYGLEIECAYDNNVSSSNLLNFAVIGTNSFSTTTSGNALGAITGNATTIYSNNDNINFQIDNSKSYTVNQTLESGASTVAEKIKQGQNNNSSFWNSIWNTIKTKVPQIGSKTVDEGINLILSSGASFVTNKLGSLVKSIFGANSGPMSSVSKIDLDTKITLESTSQTLVRFVKSKTGSIPLPGTGITNSLYNDKLGVWNLSCDPIVYMDLYVSTYYYEQDTNKLNPLETTGIYKYYLSPAPIVINPIISEEFTLQNYKQELVFKKRSLNNSACIPYGCIGNTELYYTSAVAITYSDEIPGRLTQNNLQSHYNKYWYFGQQFAEEDFYCRVSFDLVSADGRIYSFSKYFKPSIVQRNFYSTDVFE